jgi:hypothetical protein
MSKLKKTACFILFLLVFSEGLTAQIVDRSTFSVFQPIGVNDTLLVAGGQIISSESVDHQFLHGYYPLSYTLLSVNEIPVDDEISFFPNPFAESFVIQLNNQDYSMITIEILSMNGQLLTSFQATNQQIEINLSAFENGVYLVRLTFENQVIAHNKIVKQAC